MHIANNSPFCDGICFDDLHQFSDDAGKMLIARELVWMTEFSINGHEYGGTVIAKDKDEAMKIVDARCLDERVTFLLQDRIPLPKNFDRPEDFI